MSITEADESPITPEKSVRLPERERHEFVDGEVVERNERGGRAERDGRESGVCRQAGFLIAGRF